MKHHTKDKGDKGVGNVIADLLDKGLQVCLPISEHLPFDLIAVRETGELLRVSIKYRSAKNGIVNVHFKSSYSDSKGTYSKKIDKSLIDIMAIYCPDTRKVYYIDPKQFSMCINLRITAPKNKQIKGVCFADDYLSIVQRIEQ